ncbi:class I SAM-dependent methyltransferase [Chamaesiphon sp. OTE_8_metabat_110]|uniref:class I SAM-dependent methyltransferase n=1 Tax=Chamaesiphon sp. OTE_8_metabat_110 TaxID=2964696 RepID=UPI00286CDC87|nr:class I SAM-dependent methyltransferase [Chamaesiphon sp. OTE_8_metabat_110]
MSETNTNPSALHTLNPLNRFSDRAADYVKYRPSYPAAVIDTILDGLDAATIVAADIGAGTGISARLLAERGVRVLAIEPNAAMSAAAKPHPLVEFRDGKAEATGIEDDSVDLVTCFQAFHWFDPTPTLLEFQRILKSTGRLALVWNNRDKEDAFTTEYSNLTVSGSVDPAIHKRSDSAQPLLVSPHFTNVRLATFANYQELDLAGLIGRVRSNSYTPKEGTLLDRLILDLEQLFDRFQNDGFICLKYSTSLHLASCDNKNI